jgi:uncharacterized phage-associated protein
MHGVRLRCYDTHLVIADRRRVACDTGSTVVDLPDEPISAHDVARFLRSRRPDASTTQVHKWSYYGQGWHLVLTGLPLFGEQIKAYAYGPVVDKLWAAEKHGLPIPPERELKGSHELVLDLVRERLGNLTAGELRDRTHDEAPWRDIAHSDDDVSPVITHEALVEWFERSGEAAAIRAAAFAIEDADPDYAAEVARLRETSPAGRAYSAARLAALSGGGRAEHSGSDRP